ncbi:MAG: hypothetical protein EON59_07435 [Alphaproteobacteria bacterium]|nr:MAG: hypothetical protein EON59_07435 [Alphaproteobacteria bacterium]
MGIDLPPLASADRMGLLLGPTPTSACVIGSGRELEQIEVETVLEIVKLVWPRSFMAQSRRRSAPYLW